jgi:hypothetical protein
MFKNDLLFCSSDMKELALPSFRFAPQSFPAASSRALFSLLVPAAPATTTTTTATTAEQQDSSAIIGRDLQEELHLQSGEQLRQAPSARELQVQQLAAVVAAHSLTHEEC